MAMQSDLPHAPEPERAWHEFHGDDGTRWCRRDGCGQPRSAHSPAPAPEECVCGHDKSQHQFPAPQCRGDRSVGALKVKVQCDCQGFKLATPPDAQQAAFEANALDLAADRLAELSDPAAVKIEAIIRNGAAWMRAAHAEHAKCSERIAKAEQAVVAYLAERDAAMAKHAKLESRIKQLEIGHDEWRTLAHRAKTKLDRAEAANATLGAAITDTQEQRRLCFEVNDKLHSDLASLRAAVKAAEEKVCLLLEAQPETIPVHNDEFLRAKWVHEVAEAALAALREEGKRG